MEKECECGCCSIVKPGNRFILYHFILYHQKGRITSEKTKKLQSEANKGKKRTEEQRKNLSEGHKGIVFSEKHKKNLSEAGKGKKQSEETKQKNRESNLGEKGGNWKGGYSSNNLCRYDLYVPRISYAEPIRRNQEDQNILEVKCTYCGKWFVPKILEVKGRISALEGKSGGEARLYCSNKCKHECPTYNRKKYSAEEKGHNQYAREVQAELRQMVFERDNWECQRCGSIESLHCHHVEGIRWDPLESADVDKCITFCKTCHRKVHKIKGCGYQELRCVE